VLSQDIKFV